MPRDVAVGVASELLAAKEAVAGCGAMAGGGGVFVIIDNELAVLGRCW